MTRPKPQPWQIKGDKARVFTQRGATNMTRAQQDRFEAERARVMLFGRSLVTDQLIGRWAEGVTGEELVAYLYPEAVWS